MIRFAVHGVLSGAAAAGLATSRLSRRSDVFTSRTDRYNLPHARPLSPVALSLLAQGPYRAQGEESRFHPKDREDLGKTAGIPRSQPGRRGASADRAGRDRDL